MPRIRPVSDLRTRSSEIAKFCKKSGEPIFLTRHGQGELVVMSLAAYERDRARLDLYRLLDEAEEDVRRGDRGISLAAARKRLQD